MPGVAAVSGHAYGGGLQIALGADIRIVHQDAKLSVRELSFGITPDMTGTYTMVRLTRSLRSGLQPPCRDPSRRAGGGARNDVLGDSRRDVDRRGRGCESNSSPSRTADLGQRASGQYY